MYVYICSIYLDQQRRTPKLNSGHGPRTTKGGRMDVEGRKSKKINMLQETIMCLADQAARKVHSAPGTAGH